MQENRIGAIHFFSYALFERYRNLTNIVTTRVGGTSAGPYESLNLALHVGDDPDAVLQNRALVADALGIEPESLTTAEQVHKTKVTVVRNAVRGRGAVSAGDAMPKADALVTNVVEIPLMVLVADCVALSLFDPAHNAIGVVHAGWKGTLGRIAEKTLGAMEQAFRTEAKDVLVGMSPSIGKAHYEVGPEVLEAYRAEFGPGASDFILEDMDGTCYLDLRDVNRLQLTDSGVPESQIESSEMCTACHRDLFYSHRHESGTTGRFAGLVMLHRGPDRAY